MKNKSLLFTIISGACLLIIWTLLTFLIAFSYYDNEVRLEHFSFVFTILGALANIFFLIALIVQIRQTNKVLEESKESTLAANRSVEEAAKTRADSSAPRLSVFVERDFHFVQKSKSINQDDYPDIILPRDKNEVLAIACYGHIRNEGRVSVEVRIDGNAFFTQQCLIDDDQLFQSKISLRSATNPEVSIIAPGNSSTFYWQESATYERWRQHSETDGRIPEFLLPIYATDNRDEGVIDYTCLELSARPLKVDEDQEGLWHLDHNSIGVTIYPTQRIYRWEYPKDIKRPWELESSDDPNVSENSQSLQLKRFTDMLRKLMF